SVQRAAHVLGDAAAHGRHGLELLAGLGDDWLRRRRCRRWWRRRDWRLGRRGGGRHRGWRSGWSCRRSCRGSAFLDEVENVLLGYPAAAARTLDLARIDAVLGGDAGNDGRDEALAVGAAV